MDKEDLKLPANFYSPFSRDEKEIPVIFMLLVIVILLDLQGFEIPSIIFLIFAVIMILYRAIKFKSETHRYSASDLNVFRLLYDFSWNDRTEVNMSKMRSLTSFLSELNGDIKFISIISEEVCEKGVSKYLQKYTDMNELRYLYPRKTEHFVILPNSDDERLQEIARSFGIELEKISAEIYKKSEENFGLKELEFMDFRGQYFKSGAYFCILNLANSSETRPFQMSDLLYSAFSDTTISLNVKSLNEDDFKGFRRHLSSILAISKIKKIDGKNLGESKEHDIELARRYYSMERSKFVSIELKILVRGRDPMELKNNVRNIINIGKWVGIELKIVNKRRDVYNFLQSKGTFKKYIIPKNRLNPILPFISSSSGFNNVPIGFDPVNNRPVFIDLFTGSSNNILILGETGSGKSYFARMLLSRLLDLKKIERAYVLDPLNDFSDLTNSTVSIDNTSPDTIDMAKVKSFLKTQNEKKMIIIDEAHKFLSKVDTRDAILDMVRTSRHFNGSVVLVTQDISDFLSKPYDSLFNNSQYICIFRNKLWEQIVNIGIDIRDYGYDPKEPLLGGKNLNFSEMFLYTGGILRKVKVMNTETDQFTLE